MLTITKQEISVSSYFQVDLQLDVSDLLLSEAHFSVSRCLQYNHPRKKESSS